MGPESWAGKLEHKFKKSWEGICDRSRRQQEILGNPFGDKPDKSEQTGAIRIKKNREKIFALSDFKERKALLVELVWGSCHRK